MKFVTPSLDFLRLRDCKSRWTYGSQKFRASIVFAVGGRPGGLEGQQGQRGSANGLSNPDAIRSATIPPRPTIISASSAIGPRLVVSASHPHPASAPLSSSFEANPHSTSLAGNPIEGNQTASGS